MSKRKCNNYFTNPCLLETQRATESSFEKVVRALCLAPEESSASPELRAWVRRNKRCKYVPAELLAIFGFKVGAEI
jgi:hypothetical protein